MSGHPPKNEGPEEEAGEEQSSHEGMASHSYTFFLKPGITYLSIELFCFLSILKCSLALVSRPYTISLQNLTGHMIALSLSLGNW